LVRILWQKSPAVAWRAAAETFDFSFRTVRFCFCRRGRYFEQPWRGSSNLLYLFENCSLDSDRRELRRAGALVAVEPQVFDVLHNLIRNREHVVSKSALLADVWQGRVVSDATLSSRINSARSAVGDNGEQQRLIRTVHSKGFRFVGTVVEGAEVFVDAPPQEREVIASGAPAAGGVSGLALAEKHAAELPPASRFGEGAERRQMTVMLVGTTLLSARPDPEELYATMNAHYRRVRDIVGGFGGYVARHTADTLIIYFGYPQAQEDDPERAIRSALAMIEGPTTQLQLRIGIATGLAVVGELPGDDSAREPSVVGEPLSLAERLHALAKSQTIVVSASTCRVAGGAFEYRELASSPVEAWQVLGTSAAESRFEARHAAGWSSLVGRTAELELLCNRWRQIVDGEGRVVMISGEAGIGKSHLVHALQRRLADEPHLQVRFFCSPYHRSSALFPIGSYFERAAAFQSDETVGDRLDKLSELLAPSGARAEQVGLIAELLGLPPLGRYRPPELTPQQRKENIFEVTLSHILALSRRQPVMVLFEDVHWIDPTSLELLTALIERAQNARILVLCTARSEFVAPWARHAHVTSLSLARLSRREGAALVGEITDGKVLPSLVINQILDRADGVPLFLEELTKTVVESGMLRDADDHYEIAGTLSPTAIPATLHDSLMARLDHVTARTVAQMAACIGRDFDRSLLTAVSGLTEDRLREALDELRRTGLIVATGIGAGERHSFRHALIRDAAYESLLKGRRAQLHAVIARALQQSFADLAAAQPEIVAHHFSEAGEPDKAITYWVQAGQLASLRSANAEAFLHLKQGLELLDQVTDERERDRCELLLRTILGAVYVATKGYSAAETVATYKRAADLLQASADKRLRLAVHNGLLVGYYNLARFDSALDLAQETLRQGENDGDDAIICVGHRMVAAVCNSIGEFERAASHARKGWELYRPERHGLAALGLVHDTGLGCKLHLALALCHLGFQDQSKQAAAEALSLAAELRHVNSQAYAWFFGAVLVNFVSRNHNALIEYAPRLRAYAQQHEMPQWAAYGRAFGAAPLVSSGRADVAVDELTDAIHDCERIQNFVFRPAQLTILASAELAAGRADRALAATDNALEIAERTREHWLTAETCRIRGHALLSMECPQPAEESFQRAIAIARAQSARLFELRAAASLATLWRDQGKRSEALAQLAPIYGWFSEGFDTPDLLDASELLSRLA
jgi:DNA-binding winged helix-turn-helix (wHTH) protein/class 3 adenylate cyclase/tetratricopeptide (TPR) repeat protein